MRTKKPVLLVEDDLIDQMSVKRAFKDIKITNELVIVNNGLEALEFMNMDEGNIPGIILLDLNMPKMNGLEFLEKIRTNERYRRIPVIILTTSKEENDRIESFNLGIAGYMIKPVDYIKFVEVLKTIDIYWTLSEMPD
jgi:CheY-like chemotaxis protein